MLEKSGCKDKSAQFAVSGKLIFSSIGPSYRDSGDGQQIHEEEAYYMHYKIKPKASEIPSTYYADVCKCSPNDK